MDELSILTTNESADAWVDSEPGQVSTGYMAQNTNLQARTLVVWPQHAVRIKFQHLFFINLHSVLEPAGQEAYCI